MAALTKFDIAGKHAIVTGGAQGLSRGMAEGLLEAGCKVVIIDVQKEKVEKVCEEYRAKGLEAYSVIGNLADRADLNRAFDEALQILDGRLDVLVPAAALHHRADRCAVQLFLCRGVPGLPAGHCRGPRRPDRPVAELSAGRGCAGVRPPCAPGRKPDQSHPDPVSSCLHTSFFLPVFADFDLLLQHPII